MYRRRLIFLALIVLGIGIIGVGTFVFPFAFLFSIASPTAWTVGAVILMFLLLWAGEWMVLKAEKIWDMDVPPRIKEREE